MSNSTSDINRFSGHVLPLILREKLPQQRSGASDDSSSVNTYFSYQPEISIASGLLSVEDRNRIFTAEELCKTSM
jgi:hypothetical protein